MVSLLNLESCEDKLAHRAHSIHSAHRAWSSERARALPYTLSNEHVCFCSNKPLVLQLGLKFTIAAVSKHIAMNRRFWAGVNATQSLSRDRAMCLNRVQMLETDE